MLALTTKYAIKTILYLSNLKSDHFIQVSYLSKKINIPGPYLSKLIKILAAKGLVDTKRGNLGGVRIPESRARVSILDICIALEDPVINQGCFLTNAACNSKSPCIMHKHWMDLKEQIRTFMSNKKI